MSVSQSVQVIHINDTFCLDLFLLILNVTIHGTQSLIDGIVTTRIIVKVTIASEPKQVTS